MKKIKNRHKTTNENPVSLSPLIFREALAAMLKVKPKPKEEKAKEQKLPKPGNKAGLFRYSTTAMGLINDVWVCHVYNSHLITTS